MEVRRAVAGLFVLAATPCWGQEALPLPQGCTWPSAPTADRPVNDAAAHLEWVKA